MSIRGEFSAVEHHFFSFFFFFCCKETTGILLVTPEIRKPQIETPGWVDERGWLRPLLRCSDWAQDSPCIKDRTATTSHRWGSYGQTVPAQRSNVLQPPPQLRVFRAPSRLAAHIHETTSGESASDPGRNNPAPPSLLAVVVVVIVLCERVQSIEGWRLKTCTFKGFRVFCR